MATHSSTLAWKIPWMEEPGGLQCMGVQGVRHDWATNTHLLLGLLVNKDNLKVWILVLSFSPIQGNKECVYVCMSVMCAQLGAFLWARRGLTGSHRIYRGKLDVMRVHSEMVSQRVSSSGIPCSKWACSWRVITLVGSDHWGAPMCHVELKGPQDEVKGGRSPAVMAGPGGCSRRLRRRQVGVKGKTCPVLRWEGNGAEQWINKLHSLEKLRGKQA